MRLKVTGLCGADGESEMPLRLLALLAQQGVAIDRLTLTRERAGYAVDIDAAPDPRAAIIAEKIAAMVLVRDVEIVG